MIEFDGRLDLSHEPVTEVYPHGTARACTLAIMYHHMVDALDGLDDDEQEKLFKMKGGFAHFGHGGPRAKWMEANGSSGYWGGSIPAAIRDWKRTATRYIGDVMDFLHSAIGKVDRESEGIYPGERRIYVDKHTLSVDPVVWRDKVAGCLLYLELRDALSKDGLSEKERLDIFAAEKPMVLRHQNGRVSVHLWGLVGSGKDSVTNALVDWLKVGEKLYTEILTFVFTSVERDKALRNLQHEKDLRKAANKALKTSRDKRDGKGQHVEEG